MGSSSSTFADSTENFPEAFQPAGGLSYIDLQLINGLNIHSAPYALVDSNSAKIIFVSAAFEHVTSIISPNVLGKTLQDLISEGLEVIPDELNVIYSAFSTRLETVLPLFGTLIENGNSVSIQLFLKPLHSPENKSSCYLCCIEVVPDAALCKEDLSVNLGYRLNRANQCMKDVIKGYTRFEPYINLCPTDQNLVDALQERGEMFCITDPSIYDNPIVFASDEFINTIGYNRFEINGVNCRFLQGFDTSPEDVDVIRNALKDLTHARVCLLNYRKDGTRFINQFNLSPLRDVEGKLAYFIGVQIQVEDVEIMPFPNSRQTMAEMLLEFEY
jgi:PAS domain S-box-containing protein